MRPRLSWTLHLVGRHWVLKIFRATLFAMLLCSATTAASAGTFVDLSEQTPGSSDVCSAVRILREDNREVEIAAHALPKSSPRSVTDPRRRMTVTAWAEASAGDYGMTHYIHGGFSVERVELMRSAPKAWVFSTSVGSLNNPLLWVFSSTVGGSRPAHLLAQLGSEGSGPFDTYFVRFADRPYVVTHFMGEKGSYLDVYRLHPARVVCSFSP
jgi:hypothetical protein